jgi:hypothetical protein
MKRSISWDITPCSQLRVKQHFATQLYLPPVFTLGAYLTYSSTLMMEITRSSETSSDCHRTIWHYIPEDKTLHHSMLKVIVFLRPIFIIASVLNHASFSFFCVLCIGLWQRERPSRTIPILQAGDFRASRKYSSREGVHFETLMVFFRYVI